MHIAIKNNIVLRGYNKAVDATWSIFCDYRRRQNIERTALDIRNECRRLLSLDEQIIEVHPEYHTRQAWIENACSIDCFRDVAVAMIDHNEEYESLFDQASAQCRQLVITSTRS